MAAHDVDAQPRLKRRVEIFAQARRLRGEYTGWEGAVLPVPALPAPVSRPPAMPAKPHRQKAQKEQGAALAGPPSATQSPGKAGERLGRAAQQDRSPQHRAGALNRAQGAKARRRRQKPSHAHMNCARLMTSTAAPRCASVRCCRERGGVGRDRDAGHHRRGPTGGEPWRGGRLSTSNSSHPRS